MLQRSQITKDSGNRRVGSEQGSIQLSLLSLPLTVGGHPGKSGQVHGIPLPGTLPASNHFPLRGFPELVHIIVSTSLAKSSGNLYAAKPLASTTDINQAELESLTINEKKNICDLEDIYEF